MRRDKTTWRLVSLGATLAAATIAFIVWHELWPAAISGAITGGFVAALQAPLDGQVSWTAGLVWVVASGFAAVGGPHGLRLAAPAGDANRFSSISRKTAHARGGSS